MTRKVANLIQLLRRALRDIAKLRGVDVLLKLAGEHDCLHKLPPVCPPPVFTKKFQDKSSKYQTFCREPQDLYLNNVDISLGKDSLDYDCIFHIEI